MTNDHDPPRPVTPREHHNRLRSSRRSISAPLLCNKFTLPARAIRWAIPWSRDTFPGLRAGVREILGRPKMAWATAQCWRSERSRMPAADAERLAIFIRSRSEHGLALAKELEDYVALRRAEPKRLTGFFVVDPVTGQSRQNRVGRRRSTAK